MISPKNAVSTFVIRVISTDLFHKYVPDSKLNQELDDSHTVH